jgi:hypothetical protein
LLKPFLSVQVNRPGMPPPPPMQQQQPQQQQGDSANKTVLSFANEEAK